MTDYPNHRIQVFTAEGTYLRGWGTQGSGAGELWYPAGIAIGSEGHVFVCDQNNNRIQVFAAGGAWLSAWGGQGSTPGKFLFPNDVAVDAAGNAYVADTDNHRVQKFAADPVPAARRSLGRVKADYR